MLQIIVYGDVDKLLQKPENVIFMCNHQCTGYLQTTYVVND